MENPQFVKPPHHRKGTNWDRETKAKISTSLICSRLDHPDLWERLYRNTVQRMRLLEEIDARTS